MLHERVKAYKKRLYEEHAMNLAHERHILRLHDDIKRLQELVQVRGQPNRVVQWLPECTACQPLHMRSC